MSTHTPTQTGLSILESIKEKYFPKGYSDKPLNSGKDYRFSRRGQAEFRRGHELVKMRLSGMGV
jgi:hypothetical protein